MEPKYQLTFQLTSCLGQSSASLKEDVSRVLPVTPLVKWLHGVISFTVFFLAATLSPVPTGSKIHFSTPSWCSLKKTRPVP